MNIKETPLEDYKEWQSLKKHYLETKQIHMRDLFKQDTQRFNKFSIKFNGILFDYSKNRINQETILLFCQLAKACQLPQKIESMFSGESINSTENRPVLHTALRYQGTQSLIVDGVDIRKQVANELERLRVFSTNIREGTWLGTTGLPITDVVNIGIGGSHLGPKMVTEALKPFVAEHLNMHFIANIDENEIDDTLATLTPETTLFIICSKTFTTQETLLNANTAKKWFLKTINDQTQLAKHFIAVSTNAAAATAFGINPNNIFTMWDWVGGRYSLWSSIGISIVIAIGYDNFEQLLIGASEVDHHFKTTPLDKNIPVLMAMIGIWYNNFYSSQSLAILPYAQHLNRFPSYLQQADMESNGKSVSQEGSQVEHCTGPILFGELGNPSQHAFYQLLHQGTKLVPVDILAAVNNISGENKHQNELMSNVIAQSEALMKGKNKQEVLTELATSQLTEEQQEKLANHKVFSGNRPSNTFLFNKLCPKTLGALIAFYEHKIFVQGVIWNINSFDQWGVELGKQLAKNILSEINNGQLKNEHDSSTSSLINYYFSHYQKT